MPPSRNGSTRSTAASAGAIRIDQTAYRHRNVVERCFNKLKHDKAPATRYDKRVRPYKALVTLACLRLWLP
jgi:transposase